MSRNFSLILTLFVLLTIGWGCEKNKTIDVKLNVYDALTGEPISGATVIYSYVGDKFDLDEDWTLTDTVGKTDDHGFIHFKKVTGRRVYRTTLRIYKSGYLNYYSSKGKGVEVVVSRGKQRIIKKKISLNYHFYVSVKNDNCFDETDSVWISNIYEYPTSPLLFTGCANTSIKFQGTYSFTDWTLSPDKTLNITVKRNGVVTSFQQTTPLIPQQITPIDVVY